MWRFFFCCIFHFVLESFENVKTGHDQRGHQRRKNTLIQGLMKQAMARFRSLILVYLK